MKNQLDLIISLSALVIALVFAGVFFGTARKPTPLPTPPAIAITPVKLPEVPIDMANGLSSGALGAPKGGGGGGGRGGGGGGRGGGGGGGGGRW